MTIIQIPKQYKDSFSRVVLDRKEYLIRFTYNETFDYWVFGIYDLDRNPIASDMRIVPNYPLNHYNRSDDAPSGVFSAVSLSESDVIGSEELNSGDVGFVYIPYDELSKEVQEYEK